MAGERSNRGSFERLMTDSEAADLLGLHPKTLQRMARAGIVPAHRVGRFWRYRASELDSWLLSTVRCKGQPARVDFTQESEE